MRSNNEFTNEVFKRINEQRESQTGLALQSPVRIRLRPVIMAAAFTVMIAVFVGVGIYSRNSPPEPPVVDISASGTEDSSVAEVSEVSGTSLPEETSDDSDVTQSGDTSDPNEYSGDPGNGIGDAGDWIDRYYPDSFEDIFILFNIVDYEKLDERAEYYWRGGDDDYHQLPFLYLFIKDLSVSKEDIIKENNALRAENDHRALTDEQIEVIFGETDKNVIKQKLKTDAAFYYEGRLYNIYELSRLDSELLREMDKNGGLTQYLDKLETYRSEYDAGVPMYIERVRAFNVIDSSLYPSPVGTVALIIPDGEISVESAADMHRPTGENREEDEYYNDNIGSALALKLELQKDKDERYSVLIDAGDKNIIDAIAKYNYSWLSTFIGIEGHDDQWYKSVTVNGEESERFALLCNLFVQDIFHLSRFGIKCLYVGSGEGDIKDINWDTPEGINTYCELVGDCYTFDSDGSVKYRPDIYAE